MIYLLYLAGIILVLIISFLLKKKFGQKFEKLDMNDNTAKVLTRNLLSDEIIPIYYYKVIELTSADQDNSEVREYEFKHGNFIANKLDAEDWYKKRKLAFENTKELQIRSKEYHHLNQSLELILIERFSEQEQNKYFLINKYGVENVNNRLFEVDTMNRLGYDKVGTKNYDYTKNEISTKNTFLDGEYPSF